MKFKSQQKVEPKNYFSISEFDHTIPIFCFTVDVDWASEATIASCHKVFLDRGIKPTYFVTHESPQLIQYWEDGTAEFGCHPNFLPGSDHGSTFEEVCNYFDRFPTDWRTCFRSHRFFDVTDINIEFYKKGFLFDTNVFTFFNKVQPYRHFTGLVRFPSCWEDGSHLRYIKNLNKDYLVNFLDSPGITILGVHPLHMALNSSSFTYIRNLKDKISRQDMILMKDTTIRGLQNNNRGIRDLFEEVLDYVLENDLKIMTLSELYKMTRS